MNQDQALRRHLIQLLDWHDAHVDFDAVVADIPVEMQGVKLQQLPYSLWQLLEHLRFTQHDILEFCREPQYKEPKWPEEYWPDADAPPTSEAWEQSVASFQADRQALITMIDDSALDLFAEIPHGKGQTYLREVLLVADHNAYHLGEMVALRRLLGIWR